MTNTSKRTFPVITATTITIISSLIAGLLLAYFSDLIFKPQVLYTVTSSKITLPADYEKELAKVRTILFAKRFEALFKGAETRKSLSIEAGIVEKKLGIKDHKFEVVAGRSGKIGDNTIRAFGPDMEKMINTLERPEILRTLLDPMVSFPTAFSTIDIYNSGNREASDLELNIMPNGVLVEARVSSTEPSAEKWADILDEQIQIPVGIHLPPIKRLPPGGKIRIKLYWNLLGEQGESTGGTTPMVEVKGSFAGGMVQFVESKPESPTNWPFWIIVGLSLSIFGLAIGYWLKGVQQKAI